ncbi:beta-lactamase family protein [Polaribacter vadi]|nr:beta-lactamase family protein [Polaribacter vadi]MDO6742488.1 serine hydrolase domain-containing protein [Polaribacter sp. 1_MG-2023]
MREYGIKISILLGLILSISFFAYGIYAPKKDKHVPKKLVVEKVAKKIAVPVSYYPKEITKKVNLKLDSLLKRINKRHDFHGSVLVAKNKKIVYKNQVGYTDFRKKIPLKEESVFQLASVSKQFTAAAIMLLKERGKIQLTDTVNTFFPNFPYKNITIKNLLNHTSGVPKYFWVAEHEWKENRPPTNTELMQLLPTSKAQRFFKPGRNFDYSNTGYFVLASIVEKVSGVPFNKFLKENIFDPLEMKNTYVYSYQNDTIRKNQLIGYRLYRGWRHLKIGNTINDAIVGDKNVYSTPEDLFKWTYALNTNQLLSKESLDLMYTKGETIYGKKIPYGFGFRLDRNNDKNIYHYGKWNGFSTALTNYLEDDLVVIVLEHTSYNSLKYLNRKIKEIVSKNLEV